jgi:hypothetical protein
MYFILQLSSQRNVLIASSRLRITALRFTESESAPFKSRVSPRWYWFPHSKKLPLGAPAFEKLPQMK